MKRKSKKVSNKAELSQWLINRHRELAGNVPIKPIKPIKPRDLKIYELRKEGQTLQKIGNKFGLSRERIRQVLNKLYTIYSLPKHEKEIK